MHWSVYFIEVFVYFGELEMQSTGTGVKIVYIDAFSKAFPLILLSRYVCIFLFCPQDKRMFSLHILLNNFLSFLLDTRAVGAPHAFLTEVNLSCFFSIVFMCEFLSLLANKCSAAVLYSSWFVQCITQCLKY